MWPGRFHLCALLERDETFGMKNEGGDSGGGGLDQGDQDGISSSRDQYQTSHPGGSMAPPAPPSHPACLI